MTTLPNCDTEHHLQSQGYTAIVGIDEVGRGAWAGPLAVGACILNLQNVPDGIRDSKLLSKRRREELYPMIHAAAVACGVGQVTHQEIDALGLTAATALAADRALQELGVAYDYIIADRNCKPSSAAVPCLEITKADVQITSVAAASIIAKVTRDRYMATLAEEYSNYAFENNVGYPSPQHLDALRRHGFSPVHRRLFLRKFLGNALAA